MSANERLQNVTCLFVAGTICLSVCLGQVPTDYGRLKMKSLCGSEVTMHLQVWGIHSWKLHRITLSGE